MSEAKFIAQLGCIRKAFRREFEVRAAALEITAAQFQVLWRLWQGDGLTTSALAQEASSDGGTLTGILDRLEARGLIRRERSASDRRVVQIWLCEAGRELQSPLQTIVRQLNAQALTGLSEIERAQLETSLKKVAENLGA